MAYNHGAAKKKFENEWQKKDRQYRELGMTDEQIQEIYKFEREAFNSDRRYYERGQN